MRAETLELSFSLGFTNVEFNSESSSVSNTSCFTHKYIIIQGLLGCSQLQYYDKKLCMQLIIQLHDNREENVLWRSNNDKQCFWTALSTPKIWIMVDLSANGNLLHILLVKESLLLGHCFSVSSIFSWLANFLLSLSFFSLFP